MRNPFLRLFGGAHQAATSPLNSLPEPTPAQKDAGNYRKGHVRLHGLDVTIENPAGSVRSGRRRDGTEWRNVLQHHYGYIRGTEGADGDHVDCFIGPHPESELVFVIDQVKPDGAFDEHKVILGARSTDEAKATYLANYSPGWKVGPVTALTMAEFKHWLAERDTTKPIGPQKLAPRYVFKAEQLSLFGGVAPIKTNPRNRLGVDKMGRVHWIGTKPPPGGWAEADKVPAQAVTQPRAETWIEKLDRLIGDRSATSPGDALRRKAKKLADEAFAAMERIPPGQPVHSARDRNFRDKQAAKMRAAAELEREAEELDALPSSPTASAAPKMPTEAEIDAVGKWRLSRGSLRILAGHQNLNGNDFLRDEAREHLEKQRQALAAYIGEIQQKADRQSDLYAELPTLQRDLSVADRVLGSNSIIPPWIVPVPDEARRIAATVDLRVPLEDAEIGQGREWLKEKAARDVASQVAYVDAVNADQTLPEQRVSKLGGEWVTRCIGSTTSFPMVPTRKEAVAQAIKNAKLVRETTAPMYLNDALQNYRSYHSTTKATGWFGRLILKAQQLALFGTGAIQQNPTNYLGTDKAGRRHWRARPGAEEDRRTQLVLFPQSVQGHSPTGQGSAVQASHVNPDDARMMAAWAAMSDETKASILQVLGLSEQAWSALPIADKARLLRDAMARRQAQKEAEPEPTGPVEPLTPLQVVAARLDAIGDGKATADQVRDWFEDAVANADGIRAELSKRTVAQLKRMVMFAHSSKKADLVGSIAEGMLQRFDTTANGYMLGSMLGLSGGGYKERMIQAIRANVQKQTDADLQAYAVKMAERRAGRAAQIAKIKAAIADPQTLEDFELFNKYKTADKELTPEQQRRYDELQAVGRRAAEAEQAAKVAAVRTAVSGDFIEIREGFHAKKQKPVFVAVMKERVDRPVYDALNAAAKKLGGYYSAFRGSGAIPGFQFDTREAAEKFKAVATGAGDVSAAEEQQHHGETKQVKAANKLRKLADSWEAEASEILGADRKENTHKRAREAEGQRARGATLEANAKTLRAISDGLESGEVIHLADISTGTQFEELSSLLTRAKHDAIRAGDGTPGPWGHVHRDFERTVKIEDIDFAQFPWPNIHKDHLRSLVAAMRDKPGFQRAALKWSKRLDAEPKDNYGIALTTHEDVAELEDFMARCRRSVVPREAKYSYEDIRDRVLSYKRITAMNIKSLPELRAALREFFTMRKEARRESPIKALERRLIGAKIPGYFPTPVSTVQQMVEMAGILPGMKVLEPSAGKGNIADALRQRHPEADLEVIEPYSSLREILEAKGHNLVGRDFLDHTGVYDRVVMNPPFENSADIVHVRHAYDLLKPGGRLVAIMSEGPFFRNDSKARDFRDWLEDRGNSEKLPGGTFMASERQTGVNTRLVVVDKPLHERAAFTEPATVAKAVNELDAIMKDLIYLEEDDAPAANSSLLPAIKEKIRRLRARKDFLDSQLKGAA